MKVGVLGAGSIGCYVGGRLAAAGGDVVLLARERIKSELEAHGLTLVDAAGGAPETKVAAGAVRVETDAAALADRDVVLVCVKSAQTREAGAELARVLASGRRIVVVSMQNGIGNAGALRESLGAHEVLGGIVGFNVLSKEGGVFRRTTTGPLVIEAASDPRLAELARALERAGFEVEIAKDIAGKQWSKLVMNLNNAVSALTDVPTPRLLFDPGYRRILRAVMGEALSVMKAAGVRPARLGPLPAQVFPWLLALPTPLLRAVSRAQISFDPEARSSMWEDLARRRRTEVEFLNGEIVRLGASCGRAAPINARIAELVHEAEEAGRGSPQMSAEALWAALAQP